MTRLSVCGTPIEKQPWAFGDPVPKFGQRVAHVCFWHHDTMLWQNTVDLALLRFKHSYPGLITNYQAVFINDGFPIE